MTVASTQKDEKKHKYKQLIKTLITDTVVIIHWHSHSAIGQLFCLQRNNGRSSDTHIFLKGRTT